MTTQFAGDPELDAVLAHADVSWFVIDAEVVVHEPLSASTYALDPVASVLWQCLDGVSSLEEIFVDIADVIGVEHDVVVADCLPVISSWIEADIARGVRAARVDATLSPVPTSPTFAGRTWRRLVDPPNA